MSKFTTYKMPGSYKGTTDLKDIYAFRFDATGEHDRTNDVERYKQSKGLLSVANRFKDIDYLNQEEVDKRSLEIQKENEEYINLLHESGEYGKYNGDMELKIMDNPTYDNPRRSDKSLESYRMTFIDFSKK